MKNKNILITGGAGFIGSNIALYIQENYPDCKVTILDKFNDNSELINGNKKYLGSFKNLINFKGEVICGDICETNKIKKILERKFDIIFHLAAISDTRATNQNEIFKENINPFYDFIQIVKTHGSKLVYASSAAVYGSQNRSSFNIGEECPDNPYAFSKYAMDMMTCRVLQNFDDIDLVGLRYFNVYGEGEANKGHTASTIFQFTQQILKGNKPKLFEESDKIFRDFVYIKDVVKVSVEAGFSETKGIFNVGSGTSRSFFEVYDIIKKCLESDLEADFIPNPYKEGYQYFTKANILDTELKLNYKPRYSLEEGISDYLQNLKYFL